MNTNDTLLTMPVRDAGVTLRRTPAGYCLAWTDYVTNDWAEEFPTLSAALARLALLAVCAETDWQAFFTNTAAQFTADWATFTTGQVAE